MNQESNWHIPEEELEQEILILMWRESMTREQAMQVATQKLNNRYLYCNKLELEDIDQALSLVAPVTEDSYYPFILGQTNEYSSLNYFERYIAYLLKYRTKKEVRQILGCTPSYLSRMLDRIRQKILLSS